MTYYRVVVILPGGKALKYRRVNNVRKLADYLRRSFPTWKYMNLYNVRKEFQRRVYPNSI